MKGDKIDTWAPLKIVISSWEQGRAARRSTVYKACTRIRARSWRRYRGKSAFL